MSMALIIYENKQEVENAIAKYEQVIGNSGLRITAQPLDNEGKPSLWPYGITNGTHTAWFEDIETGTCLILWGKNLEWEIEKDLKKIGIKIVDSF